jgi:hypothetical protein
MSIAGAWCALKARSPRWDSHFAMDASNAWRFQRDPGRWVPTALHVEAGREMSAGWLSVSRRCHRERPDAAPSGLLLR